MKRCPLGHENPDDVRICEAPGCYARFEAGPATVTLEGLPDQPVLVHPGVPVTVAVRVLQHGGSEGEATVEVTGEAAPWVRPVPREVPLVPDEPATLGLEVHPPDGELPALRSARLEVVAASGACAGDDLVVRVLQPAPEPEPELEPEPEPQPAPDREMTTDPTPRPHPVPVPEPDRPPDRPVPGRPWLELGPLVHPLLVERTVLGRDPSAGIVLDDPGVSRRHAEVVVARDGERLVAMVADLGSTNGTLVEGQRITTWQLGEGDRLVIGSTEIVYHDAPPGPKR